MFCLGHRRVLEAFIAAAERGISGAVIYDGGFAERATRAPAAGAIAGICREAGIALCGPNCMGVLNPRRRAARLSAGDARPERLAGNVGIVSQSGAVCISLLTDVSRFGFSHVVSSGNEAVLAAADYLEYLVEDPRTEVIGAFIETMRAARTLRRRARPRRRSRQAGRRAEGRAQRAHPARGADATPAARPATSAVLGTAAHPSRDRGGGPRRNDRGAGGLPGRRPPGRPPHRDHDLVGRTGRDDPRHRRASGTARAAAFGGGARRDRRPHRRVTGDGNPLDAWGSGTFAANLPHALRLFDASPDHDIVVFCRDNSEDQPFDTRAGADLSRPIHPAPRPKAGDRITCCTRARDHGQGGRGATSGTWDPRRRRAARGAVGDRSLARLTSRANS